VIRSRCIHQPGTISSTLRKRALASGRGSAKPTTIPFGPIDVMPAKRTRAWKAMRVFAGETW
jgi:hypothetical protein